MKIKYRVKTFGDAGLEAHWKKTVAGDSYIAVRKPGKKRWWSCGREMFAAMQREGVVAGFESHTATGDIFSIPVR